MLPPRSLTASRAPFLAEYRTSHLTGLKLASLALPVSPTPNGDIPSESVSSTQPICSAVRLMTISTAACTTHTRMAPLSAAAKKIVCRSG
ncbi:MAG: hypothetical protein PWR25_1295 [Euryarchaeota archaeon]|jgi:hypothetical protein|nr:hypothetical protein [Euryarchaeota archaeon]MDN5339151.1 hypothetical protein [Euryarchaeota archaeon]